MYLAPKFRHIPAVIKFEPYAAPVRPSVNSPGLSRKDPLTSNSGSNISSSQDIIDKPVTTLRDDLVGDEGIRGSQNSPV